MMMRLALLLAAVFYASPSNAAGTFTNPVHEHGPDPWLVYQDGYFYYMCTTATNLTIWKSPTLEGLKHTPGTVVWEPHGDYQGLTDLWAPELHRIKNKWYIYFAADKERDNKQHRIYTVENPSHDPVNGKFEMKGKVADATDDWAIDASVFENRGKLYMVWSGWPGGVDGVQNIYIARLKNPWTIEGPRAVISHPEFDWERFDDNHHVYVNEGPEILQHGDQVFLIYSGSGCWTDHYTLGLVAASKNADLMNAASWRKYPTPVLSGSETSHAVSTGHNGFFRSPDGKQEWIIYHANAEKGEGCADFRSSRAQPFTWKPDGTPDFGPPVPVSQPLPEPSGERPGELAARGAASRY